ncbi:MAG TPA: hypothetical protein VN902_00860 [Candidatus Acidoferrales bacterium]|nr:hypothetical protein [Candidatus Acidoferrales bacterium]
MRAGHKQPANLHCNNSLIFRQSLAPQLASSQTELHCPCKVRWKLIICYGVWKDLREGRVGLMFAPDGGISNIFTVDETDGVAANGKTYKGSFAIQLWPPAFDLVGVGTPVQEIKGATAATRIAVD